MSTLRHVLRAAFLAPLMMLVWIGTTSVPTRSDAAGEPGHNIFDRPAIAELEQEALAFVRAKRFSAAMDRVVRIIARDPGYAPVWATKAWLELQSGAVDAAIEDLARAHELGDRRLAKLLSQPPFDQLRDDPRIEHLLAQEADEGAPPRPEVTPAIVKAGEAPVSAGNTYWDDRQQRLVSLFRFPQQLRTKPAIAGRDALAVRLRKLVQRGKAAGLVGDLYDNRDRGHVSLKRKRFPQLSRVVYGDAAREAGVEYGYNAAFLFDAITFGNSSTALRERRLWRSQPRQALTQPLGIRAFAQSYASNQIYLFPEHKDHDPIAEGGAGDVFPANTPYALISQGSSGSERTMLEAVAVILAGLPPYTKAALKEKNLIAPAVQQIFRRGRKGIVTDEDYLSPKAHPTVFDKGSVDARQMLDLAQTWRADAIPPAVHLSVVGEDRGTLPPGDGLSERVFDSPGAIARIHRRLDKTRRITVSAAETKDPNGRPLSFRWVLLRGDPGLVSIKPVNGSNQIAEITIGWHERRPAESTPSITSDRVDIGVFAYNGAHWSAPAFVSVLFPADQKRIYDDLGRLVSIDYADPEYGLRYTDPALIPGRTWRDDFRYGADGRLEGWTRRREAGESSFTGYGQRVISRDASGRPELAEIVRYPVAPGGQKTLQVTETGTGKRVRYRYRGAEDRIGEPVLLSPGD
ncbi:MAG: hypothetical protein AAGD47_09055 [Pseudomonadota bacterium]